MKRLGNFIQAILILTIISSYGQNIINLPVGKDFNSLFDFSFRDREIDFSKYNITGYYRLKKKARDTLFPGNISRYMEGLMEFEMQNYNASIDSLKRILPVFEEADLLILEEVKLLSMIYFYIGESYSKLENDIKATKFFKKVDSLYQSSHILTSVLRKNYRKLITYYKGQNNQSKQIEYLDKLLKVDSVLNANYKPIKHKSFNNYDELILIKEKKEIITAIQKKEKRTQKIIFFGSVLLLLFMVGLFLQYRKKKIYKLRFEELINEQKTNLIPHQNKSVLIEKKVNIPEEIVEEILKSLKKFEKEYQFINRELTLSSLAKELSTNANYLSKVINHYKKQSYTRYISILRVEYAINQLKINPTFRKYTIKAIAEEVGFKTSESFAKAFYKSTGIRPSYFIKELNKQN